MNARQFWRSVMGGRAEELVLAPGCFRRKEADDEPAIMVGIECGTVEQVIIIKEGTDAAGA